MRIYNLQRDTFDQRDVVMHVNRMNWEQQRASFIPNFPKIYDQGSVGSCTAQSACALVYQKTKLQGSRLFLYYNERVADQTEKEDAGSTIRESMKSLNRHGLCPEADWPYSNPFQVEPAQSAYDNAKFEDEVSYERVPIYLQSLRQCIADGNGFSFGFYIHANFEKHDFSHNATMPLPKGVKLGGHAVCAIGYDDSKGAFLIRNSWGEKWGEKGHFWMPYDIICDRKICFDFWTIKKIEHDQSKSSDDTGNEASNGFLADLFKRFKDGIRALCGY